MQLTIEQNSAIVYEPSSGLQPTADWFDPAWWQQQQLLRSEAIGRGSAWFVGFNDQPLVLRHYRRGGLVGKLLSDQYLFTGWRRSRAVREWQILQFLASHDFPAPRAVAAHVHRSGLVYRADLLMAELPAAETLADLLMTAELAQERWQQIGRCIRDLHDLGIYHADLNARNIMLSAERVYLIDFDRAQSKTSQGWQQGNLDRLERSLRKFADKHERFYWQNDDWQALLDGYASA